jgi:hypothetical protein
MKKERIVLKLWYVLNLHKKWWIGSIIFFLILFVTLLLLNEDSAVTPFMYTFF